MKEESIMRKQKFGKLLTVSLPMELYELVKELSNQHEISMGEVVRNSIERSISFEDIDFTKEKKEENNNDEQT